MKFKIIFSTFLVVCITLLLNYTESYTSSPTPPSKRAGSPLGGGAACNSCHSGAGTGTGTVNYVLYHTGTTIQATSYVPGCVYDITVSVSGTGNASPRYGFEMDAVNAINAGAGTFSLTHPSSDPARTVVNTITGNGACEVAHKAATGGPSQWYFQWTAPATNVGNVTFYLAGVYGNGSGSGGDDVSTTTFLLTPAPTPPVADFLITPNDTVCINTTVTFVDNSSNVGSVTGANYFFGTGAGSSTIYSSPPPTVTKTYTTAGDYQVKYTVSNVNPISNLPCTFDTITKTIHVINYPDASFTATTNPGCKNGYETLQLTNPDPSVTYTPGYSVATPLTPISAQGPFPLTLPGTLGNITFTMIATGYGCSSPPSSAVVQVQNCAPPIAILSVDSLHLSILPQRYCNSEQYTVHNHSVNGGGTIISWVWKLRGPILDPIPSSFTGPGPFDVQFPLASIDTITLYVTDNSGLTDSVVQIVTVNPCGPIVMNALYSSSPNNVVLHNNNTAELTVCKDDSTSFTDISTGNNINTGYRWIWGDGTADGNQVQEKHAYTSAGTFTMIFILDSANVKFDSVITTLTVGSVIKANAGRDTAICPSSLGVMLGSAPTTGMIYSWTASDLTSVTQISNPTVTPSATTTYYLKVTNSSGSCESYDSVVVSVDVLPTLTVSASATTACFNNQVLISASPTNLTNYNFNFSGGNFSGTGAGPYLVSWGTAASHCITATAKTALAGCSISSTGPNPCVIVSNCSAPIAGISIPSPICTGTAVSITDISQNNPTSWKWNYNKVGDSVILNQTQDLNVTFQTPGKYYVNLQSFNSGGASAIYYDSFLVFQTPTVDFSVITPVCLGYNSIINYSGSASSTAIYNWTSFGSGSTYTGSGQGPMFVNWNIIGPKIINLQVIEFGCSNSDTTLVTVLPLPVAGFTFNNIGPNYSFINKSAGATNYFWSFGDGQTSTSQHPIHSYTNNGTFIVTLTANKGNCSDDDTATITAIVNGIDDATNNNLFNAYHDEINDELKIIWFNNSSTKKSIEIININGQSIYKLENTIEKNMAISTINFSNGIYILKCIDEKGNTATKKWIKE